MKKLFVLLMALFTLAQVDAQEKNVIRIATDNTDLILQVAPNGRLYQAYLGDYGAQYKMWHGQNVGRST